MGQMAVHFPTAMFWVITAVTTNMATAPSAGAVSSTLRNVTSEVVLTHSWEVVMKLKGILALAFLIACLAAA